MRLSLYRRAAGGLVLAAAAVVAAGCGAGKPAGKVAGQVTYRGQPVTDGDVNLYSAERGVGAVAKLDGGGKFTIDAPLDVGTYAVHVTPPTPEPAPPGQRPAAPKRSTAIPRKSQSASTSGLSVVVKEGANDVTLELTD